MSLALINAKEMLDKDLNSLHEIPGKTTKCDICEKNIFWCTIYYLKKHIHKSCGLNIDEEKLKTHERFCA